MIYGDWHTKWMSLIYQRSWALKYKSLFPFCCIPYDCWTYVSTNLNVYNVFVIVCFLISFRNFTLICIYHSMCFGLSYTLPCSIFTSALRFLSGSIIFIYYGVFWTCDYFSYLMEKNVYMKLIQRTKSLNLLVSAYHSNLWFSR